VEQQVFCHPDVFDGDGALTEDIPEIDISA